MGQSAGFRHSVGKVLGKVCGWAESRPLKLTLVLRCVKAFGVVASPVGVWCAEESFLVSCLHFSKGISSVVCETLCEMQYCEEVGPLFCRGVCH